MGAAAAARCGAGPPPFGLLIIAARHVVAILIGIMAVLSANVREERVARVRAFAGGVAGPAHGVVPFSAAARRPAAAAAATANSGRHTLLKSAASSSDQMFNSECLLTPDGFGFSSSAGRILDKAGRGQGYHRADATDRVIDVMAGIADGDGTDVALVFEDGGDELLGIFTETDYIKVSN